MINQYLTMLIQESGLNFQHSHWGGNNNQYQLIIDDIPVGRVSIGSGQFFDVIKALLDTFRYCNNKGGEGDDEKEEASEHKSNE
jgi:hypothetical protein